MGYISKADGGIGNSDIMKALEDIDYEIAQGEIDVRTPDDLESDELKEIEQDVKSYDTDKVRTSVIDGRRCLIIDIDDPTVEINGLPVTLN